MSLKFDFTGKRALVTGAGKGNLISPVTLLLFNSPHQSHALRH